MIIRHNINQSDEHYTRCDRYVFTDQRLTDGAKVLYGYLAGLETGRDCSDKYIMVSMKISQAVLTKRKKELKMADLIIVDKIDMRKYVLYVGTSDVPASAIKEYWEATEDTVENYRKWRREYKRRKQNELE